jgi:hypothetical protein
MADTVKHQRTLPPPTRWKDGARSWKSARPGSPGARVKVHP